MAIRIVLADDHEMVRRGFRMILEAEEDFEIAGEADDGAKAVDVTASARPDVVVMDIRMPVLDGVGATRRILSELEDPPAVLMVTTFDDDEHLYEGLQAGAAGFLLKNAPPEELVDAIRTVAAGDGLLSSAVTRRVIEEFARRSKSSAPTVLDELTEREVEVLRLMARGMSNAEIATELVITSGTAKTHVARILMKLGVRDRVQAVVLAYESGLVAPGARDEP